MLDPFTTKPLKYVSSYLVQFKNVSSFSVHFLIAACKAQDKTRTISSYDLKVDIWSAGVVLHIMLYESFPNIVEFYENACSRKSCEEDNDQYLRAPCNKSIPLFKRQVLIES